MQSEITHQAIRALQKPIQEYLITYFKNLPKHLKPREKAMKQGVESLSDIELLAIFIRNGLEDLDVLEVSKRVIHKFGGIEKLSNVTENELLKIRGIGKVKALELKSLFEFSRRIKFTNKSKIENYIDAVNLCMKSIPNFHREYFFIILLDSNNTIIYNEIFYKGTRSSISFDPKEIVKLALKKESTKYYCLHNHPSLSLEASENDVSITNRLVHLSNLFGIKLISHIIFNEHGNHKSI